MQILVGRFRFSDACIKPGGRRRRELSQAAGAPELAVLFQEHAEVRCVARQSYPFGVIAQGDAMSFLIPQVLRCRFNRHRPIRHKASWDGQHFIGHCEVCGIAIRRPGKAVWLKDWLVGDQDEGMRLLEKDRLVRSRRGDLPFPEINEDP